MVERGQLLFPLHTHRGSVPHAPGQILSVKTGETWGFRAAPVTRFSYWQTSRPPTFLYRYLGTEFRVFWVIRLEKVL